jgi:hypothetical protein
MTPGEKTKAMETGEDKGVEEELTSPVAGHDPLDFLQTPGVLGEQQPEGSPKLTQYTHCCQMPKGHISCQPTWPCGSCVGQTKKCKGPVAAVGLACPLGKIYLALFYLGLI